MLLSIEHKRVVFYKCVSLPLFLLERGLEEIAINQRQGLEFNECIPWFLVFFVGMGLNLKCTKTKVINLFVSQKRLGAGQFHFIDSNISNKVCRIKTIVKDFLLVKTF